MKRFLTLLLTVFTLFSFVQAPAHAIYKGFSPEQFQSGASYGMGVFFAPYETTIYAEANASADVVEKLIWKPEQLTVYSEARQGNFSPEKAFISFYPSLNVAILSIIGENGQGWAEVVYDQARQKTGWVKLKDEKVKPNASDPLDHFGRFQTWYDFMHFNARANGIYWLTGVEAYHRSLRTAPKDDAKLIETMVIRSLTVKHIRGNWMLVEVMDFNRNTPIGWIRWRDPNGQLLVFPNFTGKKMPMFATSFY